MFLWHLLQMKRYVGIIQGEMVMDQQLICPKFWECYSILESWYVIDDIFVLEDLFIIYKVQNEIKGATSVTLH